MITYYRHLHGNAKQMPEEIIKRNGGIQEDMQWLRKRHFIHIKGVKTEVFTHDQRNEWSIFDQNGNRIIDKKIQKEYW